MNASTGGEDDEIELKEAVADYDAVLTVRTRGAMPLQWAMTQTNRAIALVELSQRVDDEQGEAALREAIAAYDDVLSSVYSRSTVPITWARTQVNRGVALRRFGGLVGGAEGEQALRAAIAGYEIALEIFDAGRLTAYADVARGNRTNAVEALEELQQAPTGDR